MPYAGLAEFLESLERSGDLRRVRAEVDLDQELSAISHRVHREGGPALLFENVRGHRMPVVTNLLGTRARLLAALGVEAIEEAMARVARLVRPDPPGGWLDSLRNIPFQTSLARLPAKRVASGPSQQVVRLGRDVRLSELPIPRHWASDAGPTLTAGHIYTQSPETRTRNVGLAPLVVVGEQELAICWDPSQGGARHLHEAARRGEPLPVAIALGGDPVSTLMAAVPLPAEVDECLFGGLLRGRAMELIPARSIDLDVPADAEFVLEGVIDPRQERLPCGPIGLATGFYRLPERAVRMTVTAITHRANPLLPAIVTGLPPHEGGVLSWAVERLLLPLIQVAVPEVTDIAFPPYAGPQSLVFVAIRKSYPGQAAKVANALWGYEPLMLARSLVICDAGVDLGNAERVWFEWSANVDPERDVIRHAGPLTGQAHASDRPAHGAKATYDATAKFPEEQPRGWPERAAISAAMEAQITARWAELGLSDEPPRPKKRRSAT